MLESLSPYALLVRSKPPRKELPETAYDKTCAAGSMLPPAQAARSAPEPPAVSPPVPARPYQAAGRTHYIEDIGKKHDRALQNVRFHSAVQAFHSPDS